MASSPRMNKHKPTATTTESASAAWRKKNADHVRRYKRSYYQKQKAQRENDTLSLNSIAQAVLTIAAQLDRIETTLHQLQNGPAIKPAAKKTMFS